jgi:hypothetical protein
VGLIESINSLSELLHSGDVAGAKKLLGNVIGFFRDEIAAEGAKPKAAVAATEAKVSPAVAALRKDTTEKVSHAENVELGAHLGKLFSTSLKSLTQTQRKAVADSIKANLRIELGKDKAYVEDMGPRYEAMRGKSAQTSLLKTFSEKLKGSWGKNLVDSTAKRLHPELFKAAAPAPKPIVPHKMVTIHEVPRKVYQVKERPELVRADTVVDGKMFTSGDLEMLQGAKGIGLYKNSQGKHVFVQWRR